MAELSPYNVKLENNFTGSYPARVSMADPKGNSTAMKSVRLAHLLEAPYNLQFL